MCFYMFFYQKIPVISLLFTFNWGLLKRLSACKEKPGFSHFSHTLLAAFKPNL